MTPKSKSETPLSETEKNNAISHKLQNLAIDSVICKPQKNGRSCLSSSKVLEAETAQELYDPSDEDSKQKPDTTLSNTRDNTSSFRASTGGHYGSNPEPESNDLDAKTFRLLDLLNEYETVTTGSFRSNFIDGFLELSRANYHGTRRFSMDSLDFRPRQATAIVETCDDRFVLIDRWEKLQVELKKRENAQVNKDLIENQLNFKGDGIKNHEKFDKRSHNSVESVGEHGKTSALNSEFELRNRKTENHNREIISSTKTICNKDEVAESVEQQLKNPLHQFGRMVPLQIPITQSHFKNALLDSIRLLDLRREISSLVEYLCDDSQ